MSVSPAVRPYQPGVHQSAGQPDHADGTIVGGAPVVAGSVACDGDAVRIPRIDVRRSYRARRGGRRIVPVGEDVVWRADRPGEKSPCPESNPHV